MLRYYEMLIFKKLPKETSLELQELYIYKIDGKHEITAILKTTNEMMADAKEEVTKIAYVLFQAPHQDIVPLLEIKPKMIFVKDEDELDQARQPYIKALCFYSKSKQISTTKHKEYCIVQIRSKESSQPLSTQEKSIIRRTIFIPEPDIFKPTNSNLKWWKIGAAVTGIAALSFMAGRRIANQNVSDVVGNIFTFGRK